MKKDSRYGWYYVDLLVFLVLNILVLRYIGMQPAALVEGIDWSIFIVLALGVWRLTDIITHEDVTEVFRAPFMDLAADGTWKISTKGFRGAFGALVSCNACLGVWVAAIVVYAYFFFPLATLIVMGFMALSAFERFFSKIYNMLEKRG